MSFWFWLLTGIISGFAYTHSYGAGRCILGCIIGGLIGAVCGFINFAASGGNLKVVAKSIVKLHRLTGGNFKEAYKKDPVWGSPINTLMGFNHLRKSFCMSGWDWGPRLPDAGI